MAGVRRLVVQLDRVGRQELARELAAAAGRMREIERDARDRAGLETSKPRRRVSVAILVTPRPDRDTS